ncbi:MAG TPA: hypothetical protein VKD46_03550 [bacterium]|nr:hypothetical protein [bacterium]
MSPTLRDIRELTDDPAAYAAELRRRWTGLLSYRYIGRNHGSMNTGSADDTVTLRRDMRNAAGGLLVAPLSISSPEGNVGSDLVAVPNPVIHCCQILDEARDVKRIEVVESEVLRSGARMGYSRSKIVDADDPGRVIALTEGQGVKIGTPPEGLEKMEEDKLEIVDSPDLPPLWQAFGASRRDDGHWVLPELSLEIASPDAALHIGPQHVVLETAAVDLAARLTGTDLLQMQSWHVMFLARGKAGPFRVDGEAVHGAGGQVGVRLTLHDEGNEDRMVTSASAVLRTTFERLTGSPRPFEG